MVVAESEYSLQQYLEAGQALIDQGSVVEAIALYEAALKTYPQEAAIYQVLGFAQEKANDFRAGIASYREAIELEPQSPIWVYVALGRLLGQQEQWDEALQRYRQGLLHHPDQGDLYRGLGLAQDRLGYSADATFSYLRAVELKADQPLWVYTTLGHLLSQQQDWQTLISIYRQAIACYPDQAELQAELDSALEKQDQTQPTLDWYWQRAKRLSDQDQYQAAIEVYQQAIRHYPEQAALYRELGVLQEKLGQREAEIASYQAAIQRDPQQPIWVYATLGHLFKHQGQFWQAAQYYRMALQQHPEQANFELYRQLGEIWTQIGKFEAAIQSYQQALALEPRRRWVAARIGAVRFVWGQQLLKQGDLDGAMLQFQQIDQVQSLGQDLIPWFVEGENRWPQIPPSWLKGLEQRKPSDQDWPRITVVTPSFNQGEFIAATILSVLNQGYPNLEYLVVDGGSTDQTIAVLEQYRSRITAVIVEPDQGQSDAINKGLGQATGDLLLWLNSDDLLAPGALHLAALTYLKQPYDLIAGICLVHQDGQIIGMRQPRVRQSDFTVETLADIPHFWATGHFFFQPEVFFSRRIWQQVGGKLDLSLHYAMDHELWLRFAQAGARLEVVSYPFAMFRKHDRQKTQDYVASIRELVEVTEKYRSLELRPLRRDTIMQRALPLFQAEHPRILLVGETLQASVGTDRFMGSIDQRQYQVTLCPRIDRAVDQGTDQSITQNLSQSDEGTGEIGLEQFDAIVFVVFEQEEEAVLGQLEQLNFQGLNFQGPNFQGPNFQGLCGVWFWNHPQSYILSMQIAEKVDICISLYPWLQNVLKNTESVVDSVSDLPELSDLAALAGVQYEDIIKLAPTEQLVITEEVYLKYHGFLNKIENIVPGNNEFDPAARSKCLRHLIDQFLKHFDKAAVTFLTSNDLGSTTVSGEEVMATKTAKQSWQYLKLGQKLIDEGKAVEAIALYQEAIAEHPHRAELYRSLGIAQEKSGDVEAEISSYYQAIELDAHQPVWLYSTLGGLLFKQEQWSQAIEIYQKGIGIHEESSLYQGLGLCQEKIGDVAGEIASYRKAIQLKPQQPEWLYLTLAHLLAQQGETDQAIAVCRNWLELEPTSHRAHQKIVNILLDQQKIDQVTDYIAQAFGDDSSSKTALLTLGDTSFRLNQLSRAEAYFKLAIEKYPDEYESYEGLAWVSERLGLDEQAKQAWKQCFERYERHPLRAAKELFADRTESDISDYTSNQPPSRMESPPQMPSQHPDTVCPELEDKDFIELCFAKLLHRKPSAEALTKLTQSLSRQSRLNYLTRVLNGEEAQSKRDYGCNLLPEYSDEEFVEFITAILFRAKGSKQFKENLIKALKNGNLRANILFNLLATERLKEEAERVFNSQRADSYYMVGKKQPLSVEDWYTKFAENIRNYYAQHGHARLAIPQTSLQPLLPRPHAPIVSIITSIYNGDEFIEPFMRHICEQSIFVKDCELIIIDANSPGNEYECIKKYSEQYDNIFYHRYDEKITIYDAWNIGVKKSRGLFLTNANLDDIKRFNCLEEQAKALIANPKVDVVYSDYAYTLEPNLPFELVCLEGHQSNLPLANTENLLLFNSPHCSPMWRKTLHDSVGYFDDSYRSAGDMELWLRASMAGHQFGKIDQTLVAYYLNPKGLSTDHAGVGQDEGTAVIQKYEKLHHEKLSQGQEAASYKVAVEIKPEQTIEVMIPDNRLPVPQSAIGRSSYFAFSVYKSGSTLLTDILELALDQKEHPRPKVDLSKQMFKAGIDGRDWMGNENLNQAVLPGYYHIGFREFAPFLESNPVFKHAKKVLLVRDPRDALVSFYYSVLKSHRITEGEFGKSQQEFREQVQTLNIDSFVKEQSAWIRQIYEAYIASPGMNQNLRVYKYEEVIFDKANWLKNLFDYLEIDISRGRRKFIWNHVNVIPTGEDAQKHIRNVVPGDHMRKLEAETIDYLNNELESILDHYNYVL